MGELTATTGNVVLRPVLTMLRNRTRNRAVFINYPVAVTNAAAWPIRSAKLATYILCSCRCHVGASASFYPFGGGCHSSVLVPYSTYAKIRKSFGILHL